MIVRRSPDHRFEPSLRMLPLALVAAAIAVSWFGPQGVAASTGTKPSCLTKALAFCEAIEPVIEAVTDGHPARVSSAARRAQLWWSAHRTSFPDTATIAPTMRALASEVSNRQTQLAAREAIIAATAALDGCNDPPGIATQLMRVELTGLAAWLHAHGLAVDFPRGSSQAAQFLVNRLRANGHAVLADSLASNFAEVIAIPVRINGNASVANRLAARVDEVEKVIH